jgi:WD40 repeat protein
MQCSELPGADVRPRAIGFSPDGRLLAAWDRGQVFVLDTTAGTVRTVWAKGEIGMSSVPGVGFTADGRGVIAHHNLYPRPVVHVHDIDSGAVLRTFVTNHGNAVEPGPGGQVVYLCVIPAERQVEIVRWDPLTGEQKPAFGRHGSFLRQLAVSADEQWVAGSNRAEVRIWNLSGGKLPKRAARQFRLDTSGYISALALSSDGAFVAASGPGVHVWEVRTGDHLQVAEQAGQFCREIAFHPTRPILACSGGSSEVTFWDATARSVLRRFHWDMGEVQAVAFASDGLRCAAAGRGKVMVWDVDE